MAPVAPRPVHARAGLTLVEVIVVLAVVGVVAAMISLSVRTDGDKAQVEANRLAETLRLAADQVLIEGRPVTLAMDPRGYGFEGTGEAADDWSARHEIQAGVVFWAPEARLAIDPDGADAAMVMTMRDRERRWSVAFDGLTAVVTPGEGA